MRYTLNDMDNPVWILASGLLVTAVAALCLYCNYRQWETPKDLLTISAVAAAYFASAVGKRIIRTRQRKQREQQ